MTPATQRRSPGANQKSRFTPPLFDGAFGRADGRADGGFTRHGAKSTPAQRTIAVAAMACVAAALVACDGGADPAADMPAPPATVAFSGVVADGPLKDVKACYDLNDNGVCDTGEPTATTDTDGKYSFDVLATDAGKHAVLAMVPATAIDKDTGLPVGVAFTLKAPATGSAGTQAVFVSPLSTAVADISQDGGKTVAQASDEVKLALNLSVSPLADFTASNGNADAALAARAVGAVLITSTQLATAAGVPAAQITALTKAATTQQLATVAEALAAGSGGSVASRVAAAVTAVSTQMNLSAGTVLAVAAQIVKPAGTADAPGQFVSLRRFAYTDANNYSYTVYTGDSSALDAAGTYSANEVRATQSGGVDQTFNRNQAYWTGSDWVVCPLQWKVITGVKTATATAPQSSTYCAASRSESRPVNEDIAGKTLREMVTQIRGFPLADSVGAHTNLDGLPVNWGPDPALLPAAAVFPAGAKLTNRSLHVDIGGTDRLELASKPSVRWTDGVFRQATTLEQFSGMAGNLVDAAAAPGNANTVFVFDLPLASQPDATLESVKRYRAAFDVAALKIRFYQCDLRKSDQAALNCATAGDGTLAISTQGSARLMRVATGYPAVLASSLGQQRFWAEYAGTVIRGVRDLERTRHEQRLNTVAWNALRTALNMPAPADATAPTGPGPFFTLRNFSYTDANNYSWRGFDGDSSVLDGQGYFVANERRKTLSAGVVLPFVRDAMYWTGTAWYACPSDGVGVNLVNSKAPFDNLYCQGYADERTSSTSLTLAGRKMVDVVNDIRSYGSRDFGASYGGWGPAPSTNPQLASTLFPAGAAMEYRGQQRKATPLAVGTLATYKVRVAPAFNTTAAFDTWPYASTLDEFITKYPGDLFGASLTGNVAFFVHGYDLPAAPSAAYTTRVDIRVAFDATGNKARFYQNNHATSTNFTTNYVKLLDTTYTIDTVGGVRLMHFAAMPAGFEADYGFQRLFAERDGGVWYAWKDSVPSTTGWSIRLNGSAFDALRAALGMQ